MKVPKVLTFSVGTFTFEGIHYSFSLTERDFGWVKNAMISCHDYLSRQRQLKAWHEAPPSAEKIGNHRQQTRDPFVQAERPIILAFFLL